MGSFLQRWIVMMNNTFQKIVAWLLAVMCFGFTSTSFAGDLGELMKQSGTVLMMRHAYAPGIGDPPNFKLGDCKTQRNLNQEGIEQAKKIGTWLKAQGLQSADIYTSPWCRCIDTATYLNLGKPQLEEAIASTFNETDYAIPAKQNLTRWMLAKQQHRSQTPTILVTHQVNILAYTGVNTSSGELVLLQVDERGNAKLVRTFTASDVSLGK